jgi:hypothetical protein
MFFLRTFEAEFSKISPPVVAAKPAIIFSRVDLPQPDGPIIETKVFGSISRLISSIATKSLEALPVSLLKISRLP